MLILFWKSGSFLIHNSQLYQGYCDKVHWQYGSWAPWWWINNVLGNGLGPSAHKPLPDSMTLAQSRYGELLVVTCRLHIFFNIGIPFMKIRWKCEWNKLDRSGAFHLPDMQNSRYALKSGWPADRIWFSSWPAENIIYQLAVLENYSWQNVHISGWLAADFSPAGKVEEKYAVGSFR